MSTFPKLDIEPDTLKRIYESVRLSPCAQKIGFFCR